MVVVAFVVGVGVAVEIVVCGNSGSIASSASNAGSVGVVVQTVL